MVLLDLSTGVARIFQIIMRFLGFFIVLLLLQSVMNEMRDLLTGGAGRNDNSTQALLWYALSVELVFPHRPTWFFQVPSLRSSFDSVVSGFRSTPYVL